MFIYIQQAKNIRSTHIRSGKFMQIINNKFIFFFFRRVIGFTKQLDVLAQVIYFRAIFYLSEFIVKVDIVGFKPLSSYIRRTISYI